MKAQVLDLLILTEKSSNFMKQVQSKFICPKLSLVVLHIRIGQKMSEWHKKVDYSGALFFLRFFKMIKTGNIYMFEKYHMC